MKAAGVDPHERDQRSEVIEHLYAQAVTHQNAPISATAATNNTLFRGTRCFASTTPKNDFGSALLRPIPKSRRAAPICAPIPEPKLATSKVNPIMPNIGFQARPATCTKAVSTSGKAAMPARSTARRRPQPLTEGQSRGRSAPWPAEYCGAGSPPLPRAWRCRRSRCR